METPKLMFSFYFLFLLLVVISFGYLAIYTNEYLLLLNNVDMFFLKTFYRLLSVVEATNSAINSAVFSICSVLEIVAGPSPSCFP